MRFDTDFMRLNSKTTYTTFKFTSKEEGNDYVLMGKIEISPRANAFISAMALWNNGEPVGLKFCSQSGDILNIFETDSEYVNINSNFYFYNYSSNPCVVEIYEKVKNAENPSRIVYGVLQVIN